MGEKGKSRAKAKAKTVSDEQQEPILIQGLVVEWNLPSKSLLVDWLSQTVEEVRVKQLVELFPKEIFDDLENIRRTFYYRVEKLTIPAYSLKLLPTEALPEFQRAVEETKVKLKELDKKIKRALNSEYAKKAMEYYVQAAERRPRIVESISDRFQVFLMPLKIDRMLWSEFLNDYMREDMERIKRNFTRVKEELESQLSELRTQLEDAQKQLEEKKKEIESAEQEVKEAWGGVAEAFDVAALKIEKSELESKVKDLKAKARELELKLQQLERQQRERESGFSNATVWARQQAEQTERRIRFDTYAVLRQQFQQLLDDALKALEETADVRKRELDRLLKASQSAMERARSIMPASRIAEAYERLYTAIRNATQGEDVREELEEMRREL